MKKKTKNSVFWDISEVNNFWKKKYKTGNLLSTVDPVSFRQRLNSKCFHSARYGKFWRRMFFWCVRANQRSVRNECLQLTDKLACCQRMFFIENDSHSILLFAQTSYSPKWLRCLIISAFCFLFVIFFLSIVRYEMPYGIQ